MTYIPNNAYDDQTDNGRRLKPKGKRRRPFIIEYRLSIRNPEMFFRWTNWSTYTRYETENRRDQAYTALVKKAENHTFWKSEYRKRDA